MKKMKNNLKVLLTTAMLTVLSMNTVFADEVTTTTAPTYTEFSKYMNLNGASQKTVNADQATINFSVELKSDTVEQAKKDVLTKVDEIKSSLINSDFSIEESDIVSNRFNIYPVYDNVTYTEIIGYTAYQDFYVNISNLDKINDIVDLLTNEETIYLYDTVYTLSNYDEVYSEVLVEAIKKANTKAEVIANAFGYDDYEISSISENSYGVYYDNYSNVASSGIEASKDLSVDLSLGTVTISADVFVSYTY